MLLIPSWYIVGSFNWSYVHDMMQCLKRVLTQDCHHVSTNCIILNRLEFVTFTLRTRMT